MDKIRFWGSAVATGLGIAGLIAASGGFNNANSPCADPRAAAVCTDDDYRCQLLNPKAHVITGCQVGEYPHFRYVDCDSLGSTLPAGSQKRVQHGVQR